MSDQATKKDVYWSCGLLAVVIFLIDLNIPLGVASGVPYIAVILLSLRSPEKRFTIYAAIGCTLLVGLGAWGSPPPPTDVPFYQVWANRLLTVLAIWITAVLTLIQRNKTKALYEEQMKSQQLTRNAAIQEEKLKTLKATMRTVQDITGNFLNGLQIMELEIKRDKTLSNETLQKLDNLIQDTSSRIKKLGDLDEVREKKLAGDMIGIDYETSAPGDEKATKEKVWLQ